MKSVQGFNYLYRRNNTYYFRFVLRKHRIKYQIMFSLHTQILTEAIAQWQILSIEIEKLKKLVVRCQIHETEAITSLVNGFKVSMQKQLKMHHIDPMIAELEQSYNIKSHTYKVVGSADPFSSEFPESFHNVVVRLICVILIEIPCSSSL